MTPYGGTIRYDEDIPRDVRGIRGSAISAYSITVNPDERRKAAAKTMFRLSTILVDIPALDRLIAYLEGRQQTEVDKLSAQVVALTTKLYNKRISLEGTIQSQQENQ